MITITRAFIHNNKTYAGAWTKAQLKVIGIDWPPRAGWMRTIIGNELTDEEVLRFREARFIRCKKKKRKKNKRGEHESKNSE